jgi:hypothetical protein
MWTSSVYFSFFLLINKFDCTDAMAMIKIGDADYKLTKKYFLRLQAVEKMETITELVFEDLISKFNGYGFVHIQLQGGR